MLEDHPLVAVAVGAKPHLALVALKGEVGEVDMTGQLRDNLKVLGYCNWSGVFKMLESQNLSTISSIRHGAQSGGLPHQQAKSRFNEQS